MKLKVTVKIHLLAKRNFFHPKQSVKLERKWTSLFEGSQEKLANLAEDALKEHAAGETQDWN